MNVWLNSMPCLPQSVEHKRWPKGAGCCYPIDYELSIAVVENYSNEAGLFKSSINGA